MKKVFLVARHHFSQEVSKRSFLIILFSMPLFLVVVIGLGYLAAQLEDDSVTLGYVDEAGFLNQLSPMDNGDEVTLISFDSRDEAVESLNSDQVDAVYILPAEFSATADAEKPSVILKIMSGSIFWRASLHRRSTECYLVQVSLLSPPS
jgi:ABC-type Na+ efflux pump permease subunit